MAVLADEPGLGRTGEGGSKAACQAPRQKQRYGGGMRRERSERGGDSMGEGTRLPTAAVSESSNRGAQGRRGAETSEEEVRH
mmetsp:Transcript_67702/g.137810  ORF Transcript_67702/g.137810 Transcript_67702/m.137810 type:complete len:82 (+) Transcript_67702:389-634(+)